MKKTTVLATVSALILIAFVFSTGPAQGSDEPCGHTAIVGATVVNTHELSTIADAVVLLKGKQIAAAGPAGSVKVPKCAKVVKANGKFIIPGLIDGHIHFFQSGGLYARPDGLDLRHRVPYKKEIDWVKANLDDVFRRYIRCGVTSVVDMGGPFWNFDVRDYSKKAKVAPRVFVAGPLIASYQPAQLNTEETPSDFPIIKVTSKEEALALTRQQLAKKPDLMKIWYVVSKKHSLGLEAFYPTVEAVVKMSHAASVPVFIHATELATAKKALQAKADVLVHIVTDKPVDDDFITMAKAQSAIVIPTLWVFSSYAAVYTKQFKPTMLEHHLANPEVIGTLFDMFELKESELGDRQKKLLKEMPPVKTKPLLLKNLKAIHDAGVLIAAGTDAGNVGALHGPAIYRDLKLMQQAGLTPHEVLVTATLNGARLVGLDKQLGSIEKGKLADLVILDADPLVDISNVSTVHLVIKDGELFYPEKVLPKTPEALAQIQLNAYNARDLDAFLSVYADDVEVYLFPNKLLYKGKETMKKKYGGFFAKAKQLHCQLVKRITLGNFVIDREHVTGVPGKPAIDAVAMYEIEGGLIKRVWFRK